MQIDYISSYSGKFQEERAGLYNTQSYDPYKLQGMMNAEERRGASLFDTTECHTDALNLHTQLNDDMVKVRANEVDSLREPSLCIFVL